jgi:hypothetical protein
MATTIPVTGARSGARRGQYGANVSKSNERRQLRNVRRRTELCRECELYFRNAGAAEIAAAPKKKEDVELWG